MSTTHFTAAAGKLRGDGISIAVPDGWTSESFVNDRGMTVFRLGSFQFPRSQVDDIGQIARDAMGPNDLLVNLVDMTITDPTDRWGGYDEITLPLTVSQAEAVAQEEYSVPAAVIRSVSIRGRQLYLSVSFGSAPPSKSQLTAANAVLATLHIG